MRHAGNGIAIIRHPDVLYRERHWIPDTRYAHSGMTSRIHTLQAVGQEFGTLI